MKPGISSISISLLGSFELRLGDEVLGGLRSRRALAVLAYLCSVREPVTRQALLALVWSDKAPDDAKSNLSWVLSYLDKLLPDVLARTRESVGFRPNPPLTVDLWQLQDGSEKAIPNGVLLEGFFLEESAEFELWLLAERERVRMLIDQRLRAAISLSRQRGNWALANDYAQQLIALDPWLEDGYRISMEVLARQEKYDTAAAEYARLEALLSAELNTEPTLLTSDLHKRIQQLSQRERLHLPAQPTPFVGRRTDIIRVVEALHQPGTRLVTLHAVGGMGKTRLAIEAARGLSAEFLDGVHFISLFGANEFADPVVGTLAKRGVIMPAGHGNLLSHLCGQLASREMLLVLDNFEPLIAFADEVAQLLDAAPQLKVLLTSRLRLSIASEQVMTVSGLPSDAAEALFRQTAARVRRLPIQPGEAPAVAEICRMVDGMPLGIELAASWMRVHSAEMIVSQLQSTIDILQSNERDRPNRQRTMRAIFDFAWGQLADDLRAVLLALSLFEDTFSALAAEQIAAASSASLRQLIGLTLLQRSADRFQLHPLLKQFLEEKSAESPTSHATLQQTFSRYFIAHFDAVGKQAAHGIAAEALAAVLPDRQNFNAAWHWSIANDPTLIKETAAFLHPLFADRGLDEWLGRLVEAGLTHVPALEPYAHLRIRLKILKAYLLFWNEKQFDDALALMEKCLTELQSASPSAEYADDLATCHTLLGWYHHYQSKQLDLAEHHFQVAHDIHGEEGNSNQQAARSLDLGNVAFGRNQLADARIHWQRCADQSQAAGNEIGAACAVFSLGRIAVVENDLAQATSLFRIAEPLLAHHQGLSEAWHGAMGLLAIMHQEYAEARRFFQGQLAVCEEYGRIDHTIMAWCNLGRLARVEGNSAESRRCFEQAIRLANARGLPALLEQIERSKEKAAFTVDEI